MFLQSFLFSWKLFSCFFTVKTFYDYPFIILYFFIHYLNFFYCFWSSISRLFFVITYVYRFFLFRLLSLLYIFSWYFFLFLLLFDILFFIVFFCQFFFYSNYHFICVLLMFCFLCFLLKISEIRCQTYCFTKEKEIEKEEFFFAFFEDYFENSGFFAMTSQVTTKHKYLAARFAVRVTLSIFQTNHVGTEIDVVIKWFGAIAAQFAHTTRTFILQADIFSFFKFWLNTLSAKTAAFFFDNWWTQGLLLGEKGRRGVQ